MDVSRAILDNLMGRDRNKPTDTITQRDHYSNPDVCKSFLACFCFNTLFPNTTYDQGPCQKRHDTYIKNMFDSDPERAPYERQYIRECIHWIERRLQEVQKKTKQNQSVIDNKSNFPTDRPKQILDRILAIDEDIEKLIIESQKYGEQGKIDDSARCLEEVEKLRDRRKEIELMGSDMTNAQKQQKICLICGAIQTINDTEKRIQTHLEGKIHQGFLKLRHEVETLKIRLEVLNKMNPERKQKEERKERQEKKQRQEKKEREERKQREEKKEKEEKKEREEIIEKKRQQDIRRKEENDKKLEKPKQPENQRNNQTRPQRELRQRSDSASRKRKKERQRSRDKSKQRRQRNEEREKKKDSRQRDRRSRSKDRKQRKHHRDSKERDRSHKESKEHRKKHKKNRSKSREKEVHGEY